MHLPVLALAALLTPMAPKATVTLTFVEPSGHTLGQQTAEVILDSPTPIEFKEKNRTIAVKTTVRVSVKDGCYLTEIAVRDQDIEPSGHFSKKEWQTRGEVCEGFTITLGPRDETRVRIGVQKKK
jgi:hypothetical protein